MTAKTATILPFENPPTPEQLPAVPDASRPKPAAGIIWLIEHYDPPAELLHSSNDESDSTLEAVASVYRSRPRSETFIEWLWRRYPPRATDQE
jgi:hypothetical protein